MNIIWTIGLFTLIFFLLYLLLTWLVKMLMRKKEDSEEPEYVTLDKYLAGVATAGFATVP